MHTHTYTYVYTYPRTHTYTCVFIHPKVMYLVLKGKSGKKEDNGLSYFGLYYTYQTPLVPTKISDRKVSEIFVSRQTRSKALTNGKSLGPQEICSRSKGTIHDTLMSAR